MASYAFPPVYAAFVWWFSTGAVLLLVGRAGRIEPLTVVDRGWRWWLASLCGLAFSAGDTSVGGAYIAFTSTILLWGAQEIAFLSGWVTGPRPRPCPAGVTGWKRLGPALAGNSLSRADIAGLWCGDRRADLERNRTRSALWTFAALWVLRQSAKINLFLGVPVTNDELMPARGAVPENLLRPQTDRRLLSGLGNAGNRRSRHPDPAHRRGCRHAFRHRRPDAGVDLVCARRCRALVHAAAAAGDHAVGLGHALGFPAGGRHHETRTRRQTRPLRRPISSCSPMCVPTPRMRKAAAGASARGSGWKINFARVFASSTHAKVWRQRSASALSRRQRSTGGRHELRSLFSPAT